jgi:glycosyltransferase involved in cell wall biosynthesis
MRVLCLCGGSYVFGAEIVQIAVVRGLAARGHTVRCLVNGWNDGDFIARLNEHRLPNDIVFFGKLTRSLRPEHMWWMANTLVRLPGALLGLHRHLSAFAPDVVLLFNRDAALLAAPLLRQRHCVFHVAELPEPTGWTRRLYSTLDRFVDRWIAVSDFVGQRLLALGIPQEKVRVVHNGIPESVGSPRSERVVASGPITIGICGQVGPWKGHDDLLNAMALLAGDGLDFRCLVFGSGAEHYVRSLKAMAEAAGIESRIEWRGFVKDPAAMYRELDVLAVPSRAQEAFGLVAAEAALNALPVVAARSGALPEIVVDGVTGFIVEPERPIELADRLARLIESPDLRRQMGDAARGRVRERFTVEMMVAGHDQVLAELADGRTGRPYECSSAR